ncbi:DUF1127 domain-containing protein [Roseovarius sp. MBR-6]|jgi:uncharacterized protein YjiS (DUF1127 family)|uniref:DUF1127 domain-containing protein n=1 Tax=Roseovarius sp. MBR-6 TaxID=3156459 RepID=UPI003399E675
MSPRALAPALPFDLPHRSAVLRMIAVWQQRRALERLDDAALADLGLTRAEAKHEAGRPFWDLPA